jgi:hypothetical protein
MDTHTEWQNKHTKSVLVNTTITVTGSNDDGDVPIQLDVKAIELDYGPVIDFEVKASVPFTNIMEWSDHPFVCSTEYMEGNKVANLIEDTPCIRAMIMELVSLEKRTLHTTTECTYKARLIKAIASFWS